MQDGTILGVNMVGNLCPTNLDVKPHPETIRIAVGKATNPQRIMIAQAMNSNYKQSKWGPDSEKKMNINSWKHTCEFWAYPTKEPGTIRVAVGRGTKPARVMMNHSDYKQSEWDNGLKMDVTGWIHVFEFLAYPTKDIGEADANDSDTKPEPEPEDAMINGRGWSLCIPPKELVFQMKGVWSCRQHLP